MKTLLLNLLAVALLLTAAGCPLSQNCEGLDYEPDTNTCVCPVGTEPDYELDACVGDDGLVIPWGGLNVAPFDSGLADAGTDAQDLGSVPDIGSDVTDGGRDASDSSTFLDMQTLDAGPPPTPTTARFPWNGFTTGSVHAADDVTNHPLRPRFMWEEVLDADHYQVQMTRECEITTFRDCDFSSNDLDTRTSETTFRPDTSLPVSMTQPVGDRYYWRVRSCSVSERCSDWTDVRYVDVGRDNHDFNGDGYSDILVGGQFGMFVHFGSESGPHITGQGFNDPREVAFGGRFGDNGDYNSDGYADVAIGDGGEDAVYVYLGSAAGPPTTPDHTLFAPGRPSGVRFGGYLSSAGDSDGDGYADLLVTGGGTFLFSGTAIGLRAAPLTLSDTLSPISSGDVNGDGFVDVVGGVDNTSSHVFLGGSSGLESTPSLMLGRGTTTTAPSFSTGDLDGDGLSDIVIGDQDAEGVYLFAGRLVGPSPAPNQTFEHATSLFGSSTTVTDVNGDGYDDLIVGAVGTAIYVYESTRLGPSSVVSTTIPFGMIGDSFFGQLGSAGDYNGDGYSDFITGAWHPFARGGQVWIYVGSATGLPTSASLTLLGSRRFGSTLARLTLFPCYG